MDDCVSNCFWSSDTATTIVEGIVIGAVIAAFIGCFVSGSIVLTDAGISCAVNVILDLYGWWLVGALIGAILAAMLAYGHCQEACAAAAAANDTTTEQGLEGDNSADEPKDCESAKRWHLRAVKSWEGAKQRATELHAKLKVANRSVKRARNIALFCYLLAAAGAMRQPWLLIGSIVVLMPLASFYQSKRRKQAHQALVAYSKLNTVAGLFEWRAKWLEGIVSKLCG